MENNETITNLDLEESVNQPSIVRRLLLVSKNVFNSVANIHKNRKEERRLLRSGTLDDKLSCHSSRKDRYGTGFALSNLGGTLSIMFGGITNKDRLAEFDFNQANYLAQSIEKYGLASTAFTITYLGTVLTGAYRGIQYINSAVKQNQLAKIRRGGNK